MATTIRDLLVVLGVDSDDAEEAAGRLDKALESVQAEMGDTVKAADDVDDAMGGMADGTDKAADAAEDLRAPVGELKGALGELTTVALGFVAAGAAIVATLVGVAFSASDAAIEVGRAAERTASGIVEYQELAFAARELKIETEDLNVALSKQTENMAQFAAGSGPAVDAYAELGIAAKDLEGLSPAEQFKLTAEALRGVTDEQERLRIAQGIYGADLAGKVIPLLKQGADGIDDLADQAHELGIIMSEEQVEAATLFNSTLQQMWDLLLGVRNTIGLALLPTLTDWLAGMRDWFVANRDIINSRLDQFIDILVGGLEMLARTVEFVNEVVVAVFGGWGPVLAGVAVAIAAVVAGVVAFAGLQAWVAIQTAIAAIGAIGLATFGQIAAAVALVTAAVVVLFLAVEDLVRFFQGTDSAIGRFIERFREADGILGAVARILEQGAENARVFFAVLSVLGERFFEVFSRTVLPLLKLVGGVAMQVMIDQMTSFGNLVAAVMDGIVLPAFRAFGALMEFILDGLMALQPAVDFLLAGLDAILRATSAITGVDLTVGGGGGGPGRGAPPGGGFDFGGGPDPFGPGTGQIETGGMLFAPTPQESVGAAAFTAPAAASTRSITVEGSTWEINGIGLSREEVLEVIGEIEARQNRNVAAAAQGLEV